MLENVYEGLNARKCNGRSNQKVPKTRIIYFKILLLGGPSPPTKMYIKYIETPCEALPARLSQLQTSIIICLSKKSTRFVEARSK